MRINAVNNNLLTAKIEKGTSQTKAVSEILADKVESPVNVSISEEGMESYRKNVQELMKGSQSYDEMIQSRNRLIEARLSTDLDYDFQLGGEIAKHIEEGTYLSVEKKANNLLESYAKLYDEIVQGYDNGTRDIHVQDNESEKGYRSLTKEEELNSLNDSYLKYANALEAQVLQEPELQRAFESYLKKLSEKGLTLPSQEQDYYDNIYLNKKNEILPDNISKKMLEAAEKFRDKYSTATQNNKNLSNLLKSVEIF